MQDDIALHGRARSQPLIETQPDRTSYIDGSMLANAFHQHMSAAGTVDFFRFLCLYDCSDPENLLGLGMFLRINGQHGKAIRTFMACHLLCPDNLKSLLYAGECYLAQNNHAQALHCFSTISQSPAAGELRVAADAYIATLKTSI